MSLVALIAPMPLGIIICAYDRCERHWREWHINNNKFCSESGFMTCSLIGLFHINLSAPRTGILLRRRDEARSKEAHFQKFHVFPGWFWWNSSVSHMARWERAKMIWQVERKNYIQEQHKLSGCARHTSFNKAFEKARNPNCLRCTNTSILYSLTVYDVAFLHVY